jgi:hypothetical protein
MGVYKLGVAARVPIAVARGMCPAVHCDDQPLMKRTTLLLNSQRVYPSPLVITLFPYLRQLHQRNVEDSPE